MKLIGIGNLATDYYYKDKELIGVCGGMTSFNIIANLSSKFETYAVGICGKDKDGEIAIESLKDLNVNTDYVSTSEKQTRCINISIKEDSVITEIKCPICNREKWYEKATKSIELPKNLLRENESIVIFDRINEENIKLALEAKENKCITVIDIGRVGILRNLSKEQVIEMLKNKFDYIQINERAANYLMEEFAFKNMKELNSLFLAKMIIVTYGKKGAEFIYNNESYVYNMEKPAKEIDTTGAGDLFFSVVLENIIKNNFKLNEELFSKIYKEATKKTSKLVGIIGARALVEPLYKIKHEAGKCVCGLELK